jgi:hypothetical protein
MEKRGKGLTKVVGAALIFFTLISTAVVVVAKSCHEEQKPVVAAAAITHASHGDHAHTAPANSGKTSAPAQGVLNSGLISDICTGIFYLVLFLGGRFFLKSRFNSFRDKVAVFKSSDVFNRPKVALNLTLSLPQLGICRI